VAYDWIISALDDTWSAIEATLRGRDERAFDALTPCPGWNVRDVVNHLTGVSLLMAGEAAPELTGPMPSYVKNPLGELNEAFVASRRHCSGSEVLDDFIEATSASLASLRTLSDADWEERGWSPEGERSVAYAQESRIVDSWIHLQDIRDALLEPADDHGAGEDVVLNRFEAVLPYLWAKRAQAPEGALLQVNLTGRLGRTILVQVAGGRGVGLQVSGDRPLVELSTDVALYWRRCAGRISAEAFVRASATDVRGEVRLAQRLADTMVVLP